MNILKTIWAIIEEFFATKDVVVSTPPEAPQSSAVVVTPQPAPISEYLWDTPENAKHSVRVICDEEGLALADKNILCAVVEGESGFYNTAKNENKRADGTVSSIDWGICQINDRYHIGVGKDFPSVDYVLANPDKAVRWMTKMYKAGLIDLWCAYSNGSYRKFLV